ncbi:MAG: trypsin-like peptidase domain-containing protein [Chloroflexi bacterium]|nr:trypsin-like peptidase domain-containing protein [Chloroflexota bacterium]
MAKRGSGSVLSQDGLILTNYHVIADDHQNLLNPQGLAFVGFTVDVREAPSIWYIAVFVTGDPVRDLAILRIVATEEGAPVQGAIFPTMTLGNSDQLVLGQTIIGLGYPAVGGNTLTLTKGTMAGYESLGNVRLGKTDSEIAPGSSGGAALDEQGRLVGIIRMVRTEERTQGRLSYFVLLSEAESLIREARFASQPRVDLSWILSYRPRLGP